MALVSSRTRPHQMVRRLAHNSCKYAGADRVVPPASKLGQGLACVL
jgi:hypothetical protein